MVFGIFPTGTGQEKTPKFVNSGHTLGIYGQTVPTGKWCVNGKSRTDFAGRPDSSTLFPLENGASVLFYLCMKRRLVALLALLLVAVVLAGVSLMYLAGQEISQANWRARDGTIVRVEQVSYGKTHSFAPEPGWRAKLRGVLPVQLRHVLGSGSGGSMGVGSDSLGIWFSFRHSFTGASFHPQGRYWLKSVDEHGCEMRSTGAMSTRAEGLHLLCLTLDSFPRERKQVKIQLYKEDELLVQLWAPNPAVTQPRAWPAEAQLTSTNQELQITFSGWSSKPAPGFEVKENGLVSTNWFYEDEFFEDRAGNKSRQLCRYEPLWKVNARFFRKISGTFPEDKIATAARFVLPRSIAFIATNWPVSLGNASYTVIGFGAPGRHDFSNNVHTSSTPIASPGGGGLSSSSYSSGGTTISTVNYPADNYFVALQQAASSGKEKLFVRARDQDGNVYRGEFGGMGNWLAFYKFDLPPSAREVTIDLILQRPREVEFFVPPPAPSAR